MFVVRAAQDGRERGGMGATRRWRNQLCVSFAATHSCQTVSFRKHQTLGCCIHLWVVQV